MSSGSRNLVKSVGMALAGIVFTGIILGGCSSKSSDNDIVLHETPGGSSAAPDSNGLSTKGNIPIPTMMSGAHKGLDRS